MSAIVERFTGRPPGEVLLWFNLAVLMLHELDAIRRREWRMLPLLNRLDDELAHRTFTAAHLPAFVFFFAVAVRPYFWAVILVDVFLVAHLVLVKHEENGFIGLFSWGVILLAGVGGGLHGLWMSP